MKLLLLLAVGLLTIWAIFYPNPYHRDSSGRLPWEPGYDKDSVR